jgi:hypothetical protein
MMKARSIATILLGSEREHWHRSGAGQSRRRCHATQRVTGRFKKGASNVYLLMNENENNGVCKARIFPFPNMSVE